MTIDVEELRSYLINYFGTAAQSFPQNYLMVGEIEDASPEKLISIAEDYGIDWTQFEVNKGRRF